MNFQITLSTTNTKSMATNLKLMSLKPFREIFKLRTKKRSAKCLCLLQKNIMLKNLKKELLTYRA